MWRKLKLSIHYLLAALVFNYFVSVLILLLNPHVGLDGDHFIVLYSNLLIFYGPLWFIIMAMLFFILQFFSEKTYPVGIFSPPTMTYFQSFTILIITFILYLNYDYYFEFFPPGIKSTFTRILLVNLVLILTSIFFMVVKRINKKWLQGLFLVVLVYNISTSYNATVAPRSLPTGPAASEPTGSDFNPRKIRIILMDGLSLNIILSLLPEQRLVNFDYLINNGVRGRINAFSPNFNLALINAALSGLPPSQFRAHSDFKFKFLFSELDDEFQIFPRYLLFRYASVLKLTSFYKTETSPILDRIGRHYQTNDYKTVEMVHSLPIPMYSRKKVNRNNLFIHLYSEILDQTDSKFEIVRKSFFLDDWLKTKIPEMKESDTYYSVVRLRGLDAVSRYFYQYHMSQVFTNLKPDDVKRFDWVMGRYYEYYDSIIGNLISTMGDDEMLVILSLYEYEPLPVWRRILVNLFEEQDIYVYKSRQSTGSILMYEKNATKKDYPLGSISVLDLYPTLLYYSGFPLSKDLEGDLIREIFSDDFLLSNPIDIGVL